MPDASPHGIVSAIAAAQHGVITGDQLRDAGVGRSTVSRWAASGRLKLLHRGTYAVGHASLTRDGWWRAAVLTAGAGSLLTSYAACSVWRVMPTHHGPIDVVSGLRMRRPPPWLRVHHTTVSDHEIAVRRGLPVVSLERAIVDLSEHGSAHEVASALDQALLLKLLDRRRMDEAVGRAHGRHGLRILLPAMERLSEHGETFLSRTERRFRDGLLDVGLQRPEMNVYIRRRNGRPARPDLYWREERLIVEIDGPQHEMPYQRERDRIRDAWLTEAGHRVLRFPVAQVDGHFHAVLARLIHELRATGTDVLHGSPAERDNRA